MRSFLSISVAAVAFLAPSIPDAKALPQGKLATDARLATVTDRQGTALVRPVGRQRWTPLDVGSLVMPGDLLRTPVRGANAAELDLASGGKLVLGPGARVELPERGVVRLLAGDIEVSGTKERPTTVYGSANFAREIVDTAVVRDRRGITEVLANPPRWLVGYRSSTTDEWMGSLVANVDGKNVPLSVGYHKVTVDVRDQIGRTTVEQSFVNSTGGTLEGVFYFPLPADASISGFGMWIGDELVEADIVEKQRARAIYEDILRRRKDPGLLEWSGGNLFKARVFPILAHSEKRVRIRYTQVLPLEGRKLRYRYGLRSELLRNRPLRQLELKVNVHSTMPIESISSPSHAVRASSLRHSASAEFSAEEYSPDRDFEVQIALERAAPLTVVPHRRGDDGYFMLLLTPPDPAASGLDRALVPEGEPLDLLFVCDTSASMDQAARDTQAEFVESVLGLLGPRDRFRLMTCDVGVHWFQRAAAPVTPDRTARALDYLNRQNSLGWTDVDGAMAAALRTARDNTLVVYVGDGIGTTGDADPVALALRLRALGNETKSTCHAVSTSSTYEKGVLEALAAIGGGSVRAADEDPMRAAHRLVNEIAQPAVKDLTVRFVGLRTARVYPERLPNLAAGTQQVILGRFLPTGGAQSGTVLVDGVLDGRRMRYTAKLELAEDETGNSFVPRLWARRHLDALLREGRSQAVADEIVAFSEEFGIMTPYTSFLVLENDADRERYGVGRRVKMRDGERFFAEGRDLAAAELRAKQMIRARAWRLGLRARMLRELSTLGVHLHNAALGWVSGPISHGRYGAKAGAFGDEMRRYSQTEVGAIHEGLELGDDDGRDKNEFVDDDRTDVAVDNSPAREAPEEILHDRLEADPSVAGEPMAEMPMPSSRGLRANLQQLHRVEGRERDLELGAGQAMQLDGLSMISGSRAQIGGWGGYFARYQFPNLPGAPAKLAPYDPPAWPQEVLDLLRSLDRREGLNALPGGIEIEVSGRTLHALRGHVTGRQWVVARRGKQSWFTRSRTLGQQPFEAWLIDGERGVLAAGFRLGRRRDAADSDRDAWQPPLQDLSFTDLVRNYASYTPELQPGDGDIVTLVLRTEKPQAYELRLVIDRAKHVVVESSSIWNGKLQQRTSFSDFVEVAGQFWAKRMVRTDADANTVYEQTVEVAENDAESFAAELARIAAGHGDVIFLGPQDPDLAASKQAAHEKRAGFAEHFTLAIHFASSSQWDRAWAEWTEAAREVEGKPGADWLAAALLAQSRRGEPFRALLTELAQRVVARDDGAGAHLAQHLLALSTGVFQANEVLELLDALRPAFERPGDGDDWRRATFARQRAQWLRNAGQQDQARKIFGELAASRPFEIQSLTDYINVLQQIGHREESMRVLRTALDGQKWSDHEAEQLYQRLTHYLWEKRDMQALVAACEAWIAREPQQENGYLRYLSVLRFTDRSDDADAWVDQRLSRTLDDAPSQAERAALGAAIQFALGTGWNFYDQELKERFEVPLGRIARELIRKDDQSWYFASRILGDQRFQKTDANREVRAALVADLSADGAIETMPVARLGRYLQWIGWGRAQIDEAVFEDVSARLAARWRASSSDGGERTSLAGLVLQVLDGHGERDRAIAFVRERLKAADDQLRPQIANQLLNRLMNLAWTQEIEDEMLALLPVLAPKDATDDQRKIVAAGAVRWAAEQLERMRYAALLGPAAEYEKLARKELAVRVRTARAGARHGLADRLAAERDRADAHFRPWFELERLTLVARLASDLAEIDGEVRELFFTVPAQSQHPLDGVLRERCAYVLAYAATRRAATPELRAATIDFLRGLAATEHGKSPIDWRYHVYRVLIALDEPKQLATELASWIVPSEVETRWSIAYGYVLAETGELQPAADAFEAVARKDELGPREYAILADWYLALGDQSKRDRALTAGYRVTPGHQLQNRLNSDLQRVSRRGDDVPEGLDPDTLRVLRALLRKASYPANYVWQIESLYRATKDFRLLECLADGLVGHTPQGVYPLLEQAGRLVRNVHEEATCDSIVQRIAALEAPTAVDERALKLLTGLVERRAAEVLNAPGPHAEAGLEALKRAFDGSWERGERRLMASFLASLGRIPQPAFADEQLRQLAELHRLEPRGTLDRLWIAVSLETTRWSYGRHADAIDGLAAALDELRTAREGVLPPEARGPSQTLLGWHESLRHYGAAEAFLLAELEVQTAPHQKRWLTQHLFRIWTNALDNGGIVSLGHGEDLFRAARERFERSMFEDGPELVQSTLGQYCALHQIAKRKLGLAGAGEDLLQFASAKLPELASLVPGNAQWMIATVSDAIHGLLGPRAALAYLIERFENEPDWFDGAGQSGWSHHAYRIAGWRHEVGNLLGDLEPRLLTIVLAELERDLQSMQQRQRIIYQRHNSYYWAEQQGAFADVAMRVIAGNQDSPARILYAARYLWDGLGLYERAIDALFAAEGRGKLVEDGRVQLVHWLHHRSRWAESLAFVDALTELRPDMLEYRRLRIRTLHEVGRDSDALAYLRVTQKRLVEQRTWGESQLAPLARVSLTCGFYAQAVAYYEELIPLHQRSRADRGVGAGTLSSYYGDLAQAYVGLGDDDRAVDAASAAVVAWGRTSQNRANALNALRAVIAKIDDLDGYAARYAAKAEETGLDAPVIRKSLGLVYIQRRESHKAVPHLLAARAIDPHDPELDRALVGAYDALGKRREAARMIMAAIRSRPLELESYRQLAERLEALGEHAEAERAWTSLVEVLPNEARSHRMLAEQRERQRRFADAVVQWQQVVRVRTDEPDGWLGLARAQIRAGAPKAARRTLERVLETKWAARFGDVRRTALQMMAPLSRPPR